MRVNRRQYISVGLIIITATFFMIRAIIFLHPSAGDGGQKLHVRFESVEKISPGTRVAFAGKPVGEVISVTMLPDTADRSLQSVQIFPYEVLLSIDSSVRVYTSDEISVKTSGLMGERFIVITPKPFPKGTEGELVRDGDTLYVRSPGSAEQAIQEISLVAQKADATMEAVTSLIERNQENVSSTITSLKKASESIEAMTSNLQEHQLDKKLLILIEKMTTCSEEIQSVGATTSRALKGNGSLGYLLQDPQLYNNALQLIRDMDTYGLLFHTNRDWQRETALRSEQTKLDSDALTHARTRQKFATVDEALTDLSLSVQRLQQSLCGHRSSNDRFDFMDFEKDFDRLEKDLDTLRHSVKNLEVGEVIP